MGVVDGNGELIAEGQHVRVRQGSRRCGSDAGAARVAACDARNAASFSDLRCCVCAAAPPSWRAAGSAREVSGTEGEMEAAAG